MSFRSGRPHGWRSTRNSGWDVPRNDPWRRPLNVSHTPWDNPWPPPWDVPRHGPRDAPRQDPRSDAIGDWSNHGDDNIPHLDDLSPEHPRDAEIYDQSGGRLDWLARLIAVRFIVRYDGSNLNNWELERQWHRIVENAVHDATAPDLGTDEFLDYMTRTYEVEREKSDRWVSHWTCLEDPWD